MNDINKIISKNLKSLMDERNINNKELASFLGVSDSTVGKWLLEKSIPRMGIVEKLAEYFDINKSDILEEKIDLNKIPGIIPLQKARRIPIVGTIACGAPIFAEENFEGYFITDGSIKADFILKAKGDSMVDADIFDGDLVFLKRTPDVENGRIAAVVIDNEATLKKVVKANGVVILQPCNSDYSPILLNEESNATIVGETIGVYHPHK